MVASSVAGVMGGQVTEFDSIVEVLVQVQKDTEAAVKGSATNISLAEAAKESVRSAMAGTESLNSGDLSSSDRRLRAA